MTSEEMLRRIYSDERAERILAEHDAARRAEAEEDDAFLALLHRMRTLYDRKNADYGATCDPYFNFRRCEELGVPAWKGALIRLCDKWSRMTQLAQHEAQVADERFVDTALDAAVYALICIILYEEAHAA